MCLHVSLQFGPTVNKISPTIRFPVHAAASAAPDPVAPVVTNPSGGNAVVVSYGEHVYAQKCRLKPSVHSAYIQRNLTLRPPEK